MSRTISLFASFLIVAAACDTEFEAQNTQSKSIIAGEGAELLPHVSGQEHAYRDAQPEPAGFVAAGGGFQWTELLVHPGASHIALHFRDFNLPEGAYLRVSDGNGEQAYRLTGRGKMGAGEFWSQHVSGDSVRLELFTTQPSRPFVIDRYAAGEAPELGPQAICGSDDKRGAACYRESHPEEYSNVRAVARLLTNGRGFCTGWLVGPDNLLLTNNHCIGSAESALNTDYEFMAETSECDGSTAGESRIFSGGELLATSVPLDYSLIRVNGTPSDEFGYLEIDDRVARVGEPIYIAGHPGGRRKEMTLESTHPEDLNRIPRVFSISESPCTGTGFNDVGYYGDTEGGSSGSPVIAQETQGVIALHHCANCPNRGVPIHLVVDEIEDFLVNSEGRVAMNRQTLACGGSFEVRVSDRDLEGEPSETITVFTSAGDSEIVELDALGGGIFRGTLSISGGTPFRGDSMIQAGHGDVVTARYTDKNDGNGGARDVEDSLTVDCVAPVISEVASDPRAFSSVVQVITDEAASVNVRFGESCSDLSASVSGALSKEHYVLLDELDPSTRYFFALEARDDAGNLATDDNFGECFEFETEIAPDTYFTEPFRNGSWFDLDETSLTLTPVGGANFYSACSSAIDALPVDPSGGVEVTLGDDTSFRVELSQPVFVYGVALNSIWIGSNGYLTAESETRYSTLPGQFFGVTGIAGFKRDLNPRLGGTVSYLELDDRFVATWQNVRAFSSENENTFQMQLFHDGRIVLSWFGIESQDALVGLSDGSGTPVNYEPSDLSSLSCGSN